MADLVAPADRASPAVHARLRDLIVRGRLPPAVRLSEADVAHWFGVSRTPAREAIRRLLADGLLVTAGGGERPRVAVAPLSGAVAVELYHAAGALEGVAARGIARRPGRERVALAAGLRAQTVAFRRAAGRPALDFDELFTLHGAFHIRLVGASGAGPRMRALLNSIHIQLDRYEWAYAPLVAPNFEPTVREHDAIADAVRAGTAPGIERAVRANWFGGARRVRRAIRAAGDMVEIYKLPAQVRP